MTDPADSTDPILQRLGELALIIDPVPAHVTAFARAAFTLRDLDAQVADLVSDSAVDAATVRTTAGTLRVLTFEVDDLTCDVQLHSGPPRSLIGELQTASHGDPGTVRAEDASGRTYPSVETDDDGRFQLADLPDGPFRLRISGAGAREPIVTSWIT